MSFCLYFRERNRDSFRLGLRIRGGWDDLCLDWRSFEYRLLLRNNRAFNLSECRRPPYSQRFFHHPELFPRSFRFLLGFPDFNKRRPELDMVSLSNRRNRHLFICLVRNRRAFRDQPVCRKNLHNHRHKISFGYRDLRRARTNRQLFKYRFSRVSNRPDPTV